MANVTVVASNEKMMHLSPIYRHDEIDSTLETLKAQLHSLLDKDVAQVDFNKRYKLTNDDIVWDFNGDRLYMAMCLRDFYNDDLTDDPTLDDDIQAIEDGLIKPSKKLVKYFSEILRFPETFFTREGEVDREGKNMFMCKTTYGIG